MAELQLLVMDKFGKKAAQDIEWSAPRLVCIAADFTKYDGHAVQQMNRRIELIRYRRFGDDLLLMELVNAVGPQAKSPGPKPAKNGGGDALAGGLYQASPAIRAIFDSLEKYILSLGDDIQREDLRKYIAFKRLRNFVTVCCQKNRLLVYLKVNPDSVKLVDGFLRDVRKIGHWGTGDTEAALKTLSDLGKIKPLIQRAYQGPQYVE